MVTNSKLSTRSLCSNDEGTSDAKREIQLALKDNLPVLEQFVPVLVQVVGIGERLLYGSIVRDRIVVEESDGFLSLVLFKKVDLAFIYAYRMTFFIYAGLYDLQFCLGLIPNCPHEESCGKH